MVKYKIGMTVGPIATYLHEQYEKQVDQFLSLITPIKEIVDARFTHREHDILFRPYRFEIQMFTLSHSFTNQYQTMVEALAEFVQTLPEREQPSYEPIEKEKQLQEGA